MSQTPDTPTTAAKPLHKNEQLKAESDFLRGNILRDLADQSTGGITEESAQLTKFHGIYAQDDRDLRNQLRREGKEKLAKENEKLVEEEFKAIDETLAARKPVLTWSEPDLAVAAE